MTWRDPKSGEQRLNRGTEWFRLEDGKIAEVRAYHHGDRKNPHGRPAGLRPRRPRLHHARGLARPPRPRRSRTRSGGDGGLTVDLEDTRRSAPLPAAVHRGARGAARDGAALRARTRSRPTSTSGSRRASSRASSTLRCAELGFLGLKYPEELGGQGGDYVHDAVWTEELSRSGGSGGVAAGLGAHIAIATPPIFNFGTPEQHQRFLVPAIRGEKICALGITEPGAGSDVAVDPAPPRAGSTAATSSTARRPSSPTACAPTTWSAPCKTTEERRPPAGSRSSSSSARCPATRSHASSRRWAGTRPTPASCRSPTSRCPEENLLGNENEGFYLSWPTSPGSGSRWRSAPSAECSGCSR